MYVYTTVALTTSAVSECNSESLCHTRKDLNTSLPMWTTIVAVTVGSLVALAILTLIVSLVSYKVSKGINNSYFACSNNKYYYLITSYVAMDCDKCKSFFSYSV